MAVYEAVKGVGRARGLQVGEVLRSAFGLLGCAQDG